MFHATRLLIRLVNIDTQDSRQEVSEDMMPSVDLFSDIFSFVGKL